MLKHAFRTLLGTCHYLAGGLALFLGENFFPPVWGRVTIFSSFLGEGHNVFKVFFIEKINYEYPAVAGVVFRFLLILPLPSKKKCPEGRIKTIYMNLDTYTIWHLEGGSNR